MSDDDVVSLRVGDKFPGLPDDYFKFKDHREAGTALLIGDHGAPEGLVAFIKDGILVKILRVTQVPDHSPSEDSYDCIMMNPEDFPDDMQNAIRDQPSIH